MSLPTWDELARYHCGNRHLASKVENPYYEQLATRRYNYSTGRDITSCRLVFLQGVLHEGPNATLRRRGRFIWCKNFQYEGVNREGLRQLSFTVDKGRKRFQVSENNVLCLPATTYVNNGRFFRNKYNIFKSFSSPFSYTKIQKMLSDAADCELCEMTSRLSADNPYRPGTLVAPRLGYFLPSPNLPHAGTSSHPYGIIIGSSTVSNELTGREFYQVRFGETTYERVHPVQMEIINEV